MADFQMTFYVLTEFDAIHFGHHHIRYNQVNILILQYRNSLFPIFGSKDVVITVQKFSHQLQQLLIVFDQ